MQAYKFCDKIWPILKSFSLDKLSKFMKQKYQNLNNKIHLLIQQQKIFSQKEWLSISCTYKQSDQHTIFKYRNGTYS